MFSDFSNGLKFVNGKIWDILWGLYFAEKAKICEHRDK